VKIVLTSTTFVYEPGFKLNPTTFAGDPIKATGNFAFCEVLFIFASHKKQQ
jgi:hypothetical protein